VAVAWHDRTQRDQFAQTFGISAYDDYRELLARERVDIVHIAAPVSELKDATVLSAEAGKHISLGKPIAMTLAEADAMVAAVEKAQVLCFPFQCHLRLRYLDLKARVDRGDIGDVILLHQTSRWSIAEDWLNSGKPGWFADPKYVPGGALIDEGIYWLDFFEWLTGRRLAKVEARTANLLHKDIGVEDWGFAIYTLDNGVTCTIEGAWTINAPRRTAPSPKQNSVVRIEIVGSGGEIMDQFFRVPGRAVLAAGANDWVFERVSDAMQAPVDHIIDCLDAGRQTVATIRDARRSFGAAMAAYDSARLGKEIEIA
jgi:predicted dehydrogenase